MNFILLNESSGLKYLENNYSLTNKAHTMQGKNNNQRTIDYLVLLVSLYNYRSHEGEVCKRRWAMFRHI